jgi:hypothetical protein
VTGIESTTVSDPWEVWIDAKPKPRIRNKQAATDIKRWRGVLKKALSETSGHLELPARREEAQEIVSWATEVWIHHVHAARKRSHAHNAQRFAAGGTAAVAAGSGAALAAGLSGTAAKAWGLIVVGLATLSGAAAAMWPEAEYERNRAKARQYEWLWRDMWDYVTQDLPTIPVRDFGGKRKAFSRALTAIAKS